MRRRHVPARKTSSENGTPSFLPEPNHQSEDSAYFYFGWSNLNGKALIQRQDRQTAQTEQFSSNDLSNYSQNWSNRATLTYQT